MTNLNLTKNLNFDLNLNFNVYLNVVVTSNLLNVNENNNFRMEKTLPTRIALEFLLQRSEFGSCKLDLAGNISF